MCCSQCEHAAGCSVCGKTSDIARLQDQLIGALIGLARATEGNAYLLSASTGTATLEGLRGTLTGENLPAILEKVDAEKRKLVPDCYNCVASCGRTDNYDVNRLWNAHGDVRSLKLLILLGIRAIGAHTDPECGDESLHNLLYRALFAIGMEDWGMEELLPIAEEVGRLCGGWGEIADALPQCISADILKRFNL